MAKGDIMSKRTLFRETSNPCKMGIYDVSPTLPDGGRIGMKLALDDGSVFHLAKAGAVALGAGYMQQSVAPITNHTNLATLVAAIGSETVTVTLGGTAVVANQYAGGYLHVNDATGVGQIYRISDHPAQANTTGNLVLNLYDSIVVALDATSKCTLTANPYMNVIVAPNGGLTGAACGVPLVAVPIANYCWLKTRRIAPCYTVGTVVVGQPVGLGGTTDGGCGPIGAYTTATWGIVAHVNATTKFSLIDLDLQN
jgi:hypothetical protein